MKTPVLLCDDDTEIELPVKWIICGHCQGHGKSSAYLGAFTMDDMHEAGPDFQEEYMAGRYDRTCDACEGSGKVAVADYSRMTKEQRDEYKAQLRADAECRAEERAERRFCGLDY